MSAPSSESIVWHEGISGCDAPDVASAFLKLLEGKRDLEHVVIWMDNCTSQNKNWVLVTALLHAVDREDVGVQRVTLKFLEKGHTSMSADCIHQVVKRN